MPRIFLLNIFLVFLLISYTSQYLFYELKTIGEKNTIESLLSFNSTYTNLEIGSPPQKVNFYFTMNHHQISLTDDKTCLQSNSFFPKKSSSFIEALEIKPKMSNNNHRYIYLDILNTLNGIINFSINIEVEDFPFYSLKKLNIDESTYLCGYIGLAIMQYEIYSPDEEKVRNIYENLAQYGIKKNEDFSFFSHNGKDYLIYGVQLHNQFPQFFKDVKGVEFLHPFARKNTYDLYWEISMKEVFYNDVHLGQDKFITFEINPLFELIVGTNDFKEHIVKDYFQEYINKGICSIEDYHNYNFKIISCQDNKFTINEIKKFPNIYLSNLGLHYNFELKGEELFLKLNNKYYFEIIFPINNLEPERWVLGRVFMRKYSILFSPFNRLIGFYINKKIKNEKEKKEEKEEKKLIDKINNKNNNNNKNIFYYIFIVLVAIIFTIMGILIGKKIFAMRKKRANELSDDFYQYDAEKKDIKNDNLNSTSIEMNSKLV